MRKLILIGGGGHCKSVIDVAVSAGFQIEGILDIPSLIGKQVLDKTIIGSDEDINKYLNKYLFMITIGFINNPLPRISLYKKIKSLGGDFATIISPTAHISKYATIGEGSVVLHQAVINAEAVVQNNCIINTLANIEHESIIGNHCHISTGSMVNGECNIGDGVFIGSQSTIYQGVNVTDNTIIGAGSVITKDIHTSGTYIGNPIRKIK